MLKLPTKDFCIFACNERINSCFQKVLTMSENAQQDRSCSARISQQKCQSDQPAPTTPVPAQQQQATSRFADYFVICGLDLDTGLEADRFAGKSICLMKFTNDFGFIACFSQPLDSHLTARSLDSFFFFHTARLWWHVIFHNYWKLFKTKKKEFTQQSCGGRP